MAHDADRAGVNIRVLLVDDHPAFLRVVSCFLGGFPDLAIVGAVVSGRAAIASARTQAPDVVLLDVRLGETSGLDVIADLRRVRPEARIVLLTFHDEGDLGAGAESLGAHAFVSKGRMTSDLVPTIRAVMGGEARRHTQPPPVTG